MTKPLELAAGIIVVLAVGIQFFQPDRTAPPTDPAMTLKTVAAPPAEVESILAKACFDCHSHQTRWPWYSRVAPVAWLIANDVSEGRRHVNFSTWGELAPERAADKLGTVAEEVSTRGMPIFVYTLMHREAKLTDAEISRLVDWAKAERQRLQR